MTKADPISFRLDHDATEALDKAAKDDMRPKGQLLAKIVTEWLQANGYLPKPRRSK